MASSSALVLEGFGLDEKWSLADLLREVSVTFLCGHRKAPYYPVRLVPFPTLRGEASFWNLSCAGLSLPPCRVEDGADTCPTACWSGLIPLIL